MLSETQIYEIRDLVDTGRSFRQVAALTGVARATVAAIARQERGLHGCDTPTFEEEETSLQPPGRCQKCGAWVRLPCVACRARSYLERRGQLAQHGRPALSRGPLRIAAGRAHSLRKQPRQVA